MSLFVDNLGQEGVHVELQLRHDRFQGRLLVRASLFQEVGFRMWFRMWFIMKVRMWFRMKFRMWFRGSECLHEHANDYMPTRERLYEHENDYKMWGTGCGVKGCGRRFHGSGFGV